MKKIILLAFITIFISLIPVVFGLITAPTGLTFLGGHVPNSGDFNFVISQIREGNLLIKNLYTSEWQPRIFIALSYIPLGLIGRFLPFNNLSLLVLGRIIYGVLFFYAIYLLFKKIIKEEKQLWFGMVVLAFSSGWGIFLKSFISNSTDLWIAESNTFHSLLFAPNIIFNQLLMVIFFLLLINKKDKISGVVLLLLTLEHQFDAILILFTLGLYNLLELQSPVFLIKKTLSKIFVWLPAILSLILQIIIVWHYPTVNVWTKQTNLAAPEFLSFITGYGIIAVFGLLFLIKENYETYDENYKFIFCFFISALILIYSPIPFQRRFSEGLHPVIVLLALKPLYNFYLKFIAGKKYLIIIFFLFLSATNIFLITQDIWAYRVTPNNNQFYIYDQDVKALAWLQKQTNDSQVILADAIYSPLIPSLIGRPVYFGHQVGTALTINYPQKIENAKKFFFNEDDIFRQDLLKNSHISYLFIGTKDQETEDYKIWDEKPYLQKIYDKDGVKIYRTKSE